AAWNRRRGRHGNPSARHYDLAARSSLNGSGAKAGEGSAGPEPKIATVERREAGVPRHGTQGASLGAWPAALCAGPTDASQAPERLSALRHPSIRVREAKKAKPRAQKRAAGTKECCLMSAMSKRTRAERELAEQLRPSCAQPMDGCACGEGAAIRTVSASAAAAGMPIDAAHRATELAMAAARATGHPRRTAARGGG